MKTEGECSGSRSSEQIKQTNRNISAGAGSRPALLRSRLFPGKEHFMAEKANNTINSYKPQDDPGKRQADPGRSDTSKGEETKTEKNLASGKKKSFEEIIAARREQMKQITDKLEAGLKEYMSNDVQFKKVLETMAKFHHYSANNVLLIAIADAYGNACGKLYQLAEKVQPAGHEGTEGNIYHLSCSL